MAERLRDLAVPYVMVATPGGALGQGGIDRIMNSLRGELARQQIAVSHVSFVPTRGNGHIAISPLFVISFIFRMAVARLSGRLDLVHVNIASDGSTYRKLVICAAARLLHIPYIVHLHGAEYMRFWSEGESFLHKRISSMFAHAARVVVLGKVWKTFVAAKVPSSVERIVVIPNATPVPAMPHVGGGDLVHILFLGRIGERKGIPQLCDALVMIKDTAGWKATLAGDGDVAGLRGLLTKLDLGSKVDAPGWQGPEDVARLLSSADILVLPSFAENLPVAVIEAMAEGIAIIATPVGAVEDIIRDGETGLLVKPGDVEALHEALARLVLDKELRVRLGKAARDMHRNVLDLPPYAKAIIGMWTAVRDETKLRKSQ